MRIKATVTKMTDAEAHKVSLVKRAASRIPFRVVKSDKNTEENGMLNLARILKREDTTPVSTAPEVAAMVVQKADADDAMKTVLEGAGFEIGDTVENEDGTVTFVRKGETLEGETDVVRQSDDLLLVMKGFRPYTDDLTDFAEMAQSRGFYSGICTASDILSGAINNALDEASSPSDAATAIGQMVDAYRKYVTGMASALPTIAFKAEKAVAAHKKTKPAADAAPGSVQASTEVANPQAVVKAEGEGEDAKPVVEGEQAEPVVEAEAAAAVVTDPPAVTEEAKLSEVLKAELDKFVQSLDSLRNEVAEVRKTNENLQTSVTEAVKKSEDLAKSLGSTVIGTAPADDEPSTRGQQVKKAEFEPLTDTAFMSRSKQYR